MRLHIKDKLFIFITGYLIIAAMTFIMLISFFMEGWVVNEYKQKLISNFQDTQADFNKQTNLSDFLRRKEKGLGGFMTLINHEMSVIASTSPELIHVSRLPPSIHTIVQKHIDNPDFDWFIFQFNIPEINLDNLALIGKLIDNVYVFYEKPLSIVQETIHFSTEAMLTTSSIVLIPGILFAFFFSRVFTRPIFQINRKAHAIADLDFSFPLQLKNRDELGDLAQTMNHISERLRITIGQLQNSNDQLEIDKMELKELNEQLEKLSITDTLTELDNRRRVDQVLNEEVYKSEVRGQTFSIILLDIDNFKEINDTYGHHLGDDLLIEFARILQKNSRRIDTVGRWGGEEFILILPNTNQEGATATAEKLRKEIEQYSFNNIGNRTASFGVGEYNEELNLTLFMKRIDQALYRAKNEGKNRVEQI